MGKFSVFCIWEQIGKETK